jgi:hypothetical protein
MSKKLKRKLLMNTSLKSLLGGLFIYNTVVKATFAANMPTQFFANANINATCTFSASVMSFLSYDAAAASPTTATSVITVDCSNLLLYSVSIADSSNGAGGTYKLVSQGGDENTYSNYLLVSFKKTDANGLAMTSGATAISGTGTGGAATAGFIYGSIAAGQTGKIGASYSKSISLNLVYEN